MGTILLVEDDISIHPFMRDLLEIVLTEASGSTTIAAAATGAACAALLQQDTPDLILLDVNLPDTNGLVLYRRLRQTARLARVPVLFVTAVPDLVRQAALEGRYACLAKPFGLNAFIACVRGLLGLNTASQAGSA